MIDSGKTDSSPPRPTDDLTPSQGRAVLVERLKVIAGIFDTSASQLLHERITGDMLKQLYAAEELLHSEIDALERILGEH